MNLKFSFVEGLEIGRDKRVSKAKEAITRRNKTKAELLKRADELQARADVCRRTDPEKARRLEHQSRKLKNEEYRMRKENNKPMTFEEIKRSALLGECALLVDAQKSK